MSTRPRPPSAARKPRSDAARRILIVDDDARIRSLLAWRLEADGWQVHEAADGPAAIRLVDELSPDFVLLDLNLPGLGGLDVLARIREAGDLPVIVLTARAGEADRVVGLDLGADDYVVKPFSPAEVAARVRAVLRRGGHDGSDRLEFANLTIDRRTRDVILGGQRTEVTRTEFDLLWCLASAPRQVFTRAHLLDLVWGARNEPWQGESTVTQTVHRLRLKLETDPAQPRHLSTVPGVGYRFEP